MNEHSNTSVLVLDSDDLIGSVIAKYLKSTGYNTTLLSSEKKLGETLSQKSFQIMILDSSEDITKTIRILKDAHKIDPKIVHIVMLSNPQIETLMKLVRVGIKNIFIKPFNFTDFNQLLVDAGKQYNENREFALYKENREIIVSVLREQGINDFTQHEFEII